jgi:pimeloyl-ACP methyl ester carboxylesterase
MSAIYIENHLVHYEVLGRGKPVLLLHGWIGSWRYWIPTMQSISTDFRAYALDLWGFGESEHLQSHYHLDGQVNLLRAFLASMGLKNVSIVGHGLGGLAALRLASQSPALVERLMLISVPPNGSSLDRRFSYSPADELASWLLQRVEDNTSVHNESRRTDPLALQSWSLGDSSEELITENDLLDLSCLFVFGQKDPAVPAPKSKSRKKNIFNNHAIVFEGVGHFPMLENATKFNRLLKDFLTIPTGKPVSDLRLKSEWKRRVR